MIIIRLCSLVLIPSPSSSSALDPPRTSQAGFLKTNIQIQTWNCLLHLVFYLEYSCRPTLNRQNCETHRNSPGLWRLQSLSVLLNNPNDLISSITLKTRPARRTQPERKSLFMIKLYDFNHCLNMSLNLRNKFYMSNQKLNICNLFYKYFCLFNFAQTTVCL